MATIEALDAGISDIRARIALLQSHRANLASILLSQPHLSTRLEQRPVTHERQRNHASKIVKKQTTRNLENIYRACAGVTAYQVKDPDPHAVDNGRILGVRIDVFVRGKFIETYHVLFNRPDERHRRMLRIHKHTIPTCIPLQPLQKKWLPLPRKGVDEATEQQLVRFGRALRKELVAWHLRIEAVERLRVEAGLGDRDVREAGEGTKPASGKVLNAFVSDDEDEEDEHEHKRRHPGSVKIAEIEADTAAREITITWSNGQRGAMEVTKDGNVEKAVVKTAEGVRVSDLGRKAIGRIEGLVQRLAA